MKPVKLTLENIGPFVGVKVIDFSKLNDMFLICGDTGAGKTTILDAITYALYGELCGNHAPDERTLRSDFAKEGEPSFIELEFSLRGGLYKIQRKPPAPYVNRNGNLGEKPSEVAFFKKEGAGEWKLVCNQKNETNERVKRLLCLSADEFSQIVLLPQGDFAEFLHLKSDERRKALSKLFPVEGYRRITECAERQSKEFTTKLALVEQNIAKLRAEFDFEQAEGEIARLGRAAEESRAEKERLGALLLEQSTALDNAERIAQKFAALRAAREKLAELERSKGEIERSEEKIARSRAALNCKSTFDALMLLVERQNELSESQSACARELSAAHDLQGKLLARAEEIERLKAENEQLSKTISKLQIAIPVESDLQSAEADAQKFARSAEQLLQREQNLQQRIAPLAAELENCGEAAADTQALVKADEDAASALAQAKEELKKLGEYNAVKSEFDKNLEGLEASRAKTGRLQNEALLLGGEIEALKERLAAAEHADMAFALACGLEEGAPCPVCGSTSHPRLAQKLGKDFSLAEQLEIKEARLAECAQSLNEAEKTFAGISAKLEVAKRNLEKLGEPVPNAAELVEECSKRKSQTKNALDRLLQAQHRRQDLQNKRQTLENELKPLQEQLNDANKKLAVAQSAAKNLRAHLANLLGGMPCESGGAQALLAQSSARRRENAEEVEKHESALQGAGEKLAALNAQAKTLAENAAANAAQFAQTDRALDGLLLRNGFASAEEMAASLLAPEDTAALEANAAEWKRLHAEFSARRGQLEEELAGESEADVQQLKSAFDETGARLKEVEADLGGFAVQIQQIADKQARWRQYEDERRELSRESVRYKRLADDLSGKNPKKLSFESWILGIHLDEITRHATKRLERVSNNRYKLLLKTEGASGKQRYSGLDLEIFDAETGKKRSCDTLSGGETFLVSISLALALTDVVQSKNGSIQLDSLFIDEGFGTLDEKTLEKAMSVLDEIRENRMIGIVSHRLELKSRILTHIEVQKTSNGSDIRING